MSLIADTVPKCQMNHNCHFVGMWDVFKEQHRKRNENPNTITDMCDGDFMRQDPFFNLVENAGVILCSDGVPVFKSSGMS